jgi:filamentous hemagglutinin family protein
MIKNNFFHPYRQLNLQHLPRILAIILLVGGFWQVKNDKVGAQIVPDTTLPNNSIINTVDNLIEITGGTTAGNNLFHSFSSFALPSNWQASFLNDATIQNIITRITGNLPSEIDGTLRANSSANLILVNPNGIIFGPNASLNLGGSFLGTTANSLLFGDGREFSATNPAATPILSLNVPIGLQFGHNNGEIVLVGNGNNLIYDFNTSTIVRDFRNLGLQMNNERSLALIGGNISLNGGNLTAPDGNIELGAVGDGVVSLKSTPTGWTFDYENAGAGQNIQLVAAASLDVSGNRGGNVSIWGNNLLVADASAILADTLGNGTGGRIRLQTSESIEAVGFSLDETIPFITYISADLAPNATGSGGKIEIDTNNLFVGFGAQISTGTFGFGNAGSITVNAPTIILTSGSPITGGSGLFSPVAFGVTGKGGQITIETQNLSLSDGAQIGSFSFGLGDAGDIKIQATNSLEIVGTSPNGSPSNISANTFSPIGKGGNIEIDTNNLVIGFGGKIFSSTFGAGDGGTINIKAADITLTGGANGAGASGLFTEVLPEATGKGGLIEILTENLTISDGASISLSSFGLGGAGSISIRGQTIAILGTAPNGQPSNISVNNFAGKGGQIEIFGEELTISGGSIESLTDGTNAAGDITLQLNKLVMDQGGVIFNNTRGGSGNAGNIEIEAQVIELIGINLATPFSPQTSITSTVIDFASGNGGNITIDTERLILKDGAQIAVSTAGSGNGGILVVNATDSINLSGLANSGRTGLFASAIIGTGDGGEIIVNTDRLTISDRAIISTSNFFSGDPTVPSGQGAAGNLSLNAEILELQEGGSIVTDVAVGDEGNIFLTVDRLLLSGESSIRANAFDTATGGNINISAETIIAFGNSDITANSQNNFAGRVSIDTQGIFGTKFSERLTPDSDITAFSASGVLFNGIVIINTPDVDPSKGLVELNSDPTDVEKRIIAGCSENTNNNFTIGGRGGLPESPTEVLSGRSIWQDWRALDYTNSPTPTEIDNTQSKNESPQRQIVEAGGFVKNSHGTIISLGLPTSTLRAIPLTCTQP